MHKDLCSKSFSKQWQLNALIHAANQTREINVACVVSGTMPGVLNAVRILLIGMGILD